MTEVSNITNGVEYYSPATNNTEEPSGDALEAMDFMNLFMIQLTNQNPLEPMDDSEMMSQMAQMNTVNELELLNETVKELTRSNSLMSASNLIGKEVSYENSDGEVIVGVVEFVSMDGSDAFLMIGETSVHLDDVIKVS
ncbi:MAG: hypothetical protein JEZ06_10465 [Anaerolineaceae bacterium]|nr:hypothetical protein [Anaerolineaceae bacterium]